jgi:hypothetical protein
MSARDIINETLLPKLERELTDEARGNKHEDALKAITRLKGSNQIGVKTSFKDDESANLLRHVCQFQTVSTEGSPRSAVPKPYSIVMSGLTSSEKQIPRNC